MWENAIYLKLFPLWVELDSNNSHLLGKDSQSQPPQLSWFAATSEERVSVSLPAVISASFSSNLTIQLETFGPVELWTSTMISSVSGRIRALNLWRALVVRDEAGLRAKTVVAFCCKWFNLFPSPSSSALCDLYQPKATHPSSWTSADYSISSPDVLGYNTLTIYICIELSNASLQQNSVCSTKINSGRASCWATGTTCLSPDLFLKYLDLVSIYSK